MTEQTTDFEFEAQDNTEQRHVEVDKSKYTTIDNLNEDDAIPAQRFCLVSFISPEGLMNCTVRGVKVRGNYETEAEARRAADILRKKDIYFDVFIGEVGKWLPWDPNPMSIPDANYANKKLNTIMKSVHEHNTENLNEMVGRKKELIAQSKTSHKQRVANSIKANLAQKEDAVEEVVKPTADGEHHGAAAEEEQTKKPRVTLTSHNPDVRRQKIKKILEARGAKNNAATNNVKTEYEPQHAGDMNDEATKITQNLNKMKELYKQSAKA